MFCALILRADNIIRGHKIVEMLSQTLIVHFSKNISLESPQLSLLKKYTTI